MPRPAPITALITAYNAGPFLEAALRSVQSQTLPVAEILVIDDGSTDNSGDVARSLGAKVIRQANKGRPSALNTGLRAATQDWVAFLDQDDLWESEKIELQWLAHELCPDAGLIVTDFCQFDDSSGEVREPSAFRLPEAGFAHLERLFVTDYISYLPKIDESLFKTVKKNVFFPSTAMARREMVISIGLWGEDLFPVDDVDFFLRCFARAPLAMVERPLMRYRLHNANASKNELRQLLCFFKLVKRIVERPHQYPPGAVSFFTAPDPLSRKYEGAGRLMMDTGNFSQARSLLKESLRLRKAPKPAALWLSTLLGPSAVGQMLKVKRLLKRNAANSATGAQE